ncbi:MAG: translation elongation factor Ts [Clostridia bacterium]|nr:translation elongation factor Ts [Clostridia bacterium]
MFSGSDVIALRQKTGAGVLDCKKALTESNGDMDKAIDFLREKGIASAAKKASRIAAEGIVAAKVAGKVGALVEVNCETDFVANGEGFRAFVDSVADYVIANDVKDNEALATAKNDETVAATAKIGEKIAIRRFAKYEASNGIVETYIHMGGKVGVMVEIEGCDCDATKELAHDIALQIAASKPLYINPEEVPAEVLEHEKDILIAQIKNDPKLANKPQQIIEKMVEGKVGKYYDENCLMKQAFVKDPSITIDKVIKAVADKAGKVLTVKRFTRFEMGEGLEKKVNDFAAEVEAQMRK